MESHNAKSSLFHTHKSDTTVKSMEWTEYRPVGQLNSEGALEFNVSGNSTKYVDLQNTKLKVKFRILQENGSVLPAAVAGDKPTPDAAKVGPTNLFLQTMWRQVDVTVQQQVVSANIATKYPYKAYIETLLNYGEDAKRTQLQSQLYFKDQGDVSNNDPMSGTNTGLIQRAIFTEKSKEVDLEGPVYMDICQQQRYVLNGVQVGFKFWPSPVSFKLMSSNPNAAYKLDIKEAVLKVCMVEMSPEVIVSHANMLKERPAKYFFDRTDVKSYAIAKGQYGCTLEDIYQGDVPKRLVVGFVSSEAFMGSYSKNPLDFKNYNCNFIGFYVDGKSTPAEPLAPNFKNANYLSAYMTTFGGDGYRQNFGHDISRDDYPKGYCLFVFDVCQDHCEKYGPNVKKGHTRLEIKFSEPLPEAMTLIAYANFPGLMEIDEARGVKLY